MQQPTFPDLTNFSNNPWSTFLLQYCNGNLINSITIREILHHKKRGRILMRKGGQKTQKTTVSEYTHSHNQSGLVFDVIQPARRACALKALWLLLAHGAPTLGGGRLFDGSTFFYENCCNSGKESRKINPKVEN